MTVKSKIPYFSIFALLCATWFALTGWVWGYFVNVVFSMPFGLIGFFLWWKGRKSGESPMVNKTAGFMLIAGLIVTFGSLAFFTL
jgi:hypothetical protein